MNASAIPHFDADSTAFKTWIDARNLIGGAWVDALDDHGSLDVINPRHGKAMAKVVMSGAADVNAAVQAARVNLRAWQDRPIRERAEVFYKLRELMLRDLESLTWLVSHENGKTYDEAKAEVLKAVECVEFGCSLPNLAAGTQLDVSRGVNCRIEYAPVGIVAGVTPFNFPLMVPLWMLPQAIVGGNAFILKPSEQTPLSAVALGELFREAGLPARPSRRSATTRASARSASSAAPASPSSSTAGPAPPASAPCASAAPRTTSSWCRTPTATAPAATSSRA